MAKRSTKKKSMKKKPLKKKAKSKTKKTTKKPTKKATSAQPKLKAIPKASVVLGQAIPDYELPATGGQNISLSQFKGKKVVLFFYPKDMTPGCTLEGRDFTQLKDDFEKNGAVVFGVSRDSVASHEKFRLKEGYTIDLLSDSDERLCHAFGVIKEKNMYGKKVLGIERSTFVIDQEGRLEKEWRKVSVPEHAAQVLEYIKQAY